MTISSARYFWSKVIHNKASSPPTPEKHFDTDGQSLIEGVSEALLSQARYIDLGGAYELPPGDPVTHFGIRFAKIMAL